MRIKEIAKVVGLFLVIVLIYSCQQKPTPPSPSQDGIWEQMGYGKILEIKNDSAKIYDICKVGCVEFDHVALSELGTIELISKDSLIQRKNIKTYRYARLDKLPELCTSSNQDFNDPVYNYEFLWNTFNENYSFFKERNIDWNQMYQEYRKGISKNTSEIELFQSLENMLTTLNDGHVELVPPDHLEDTLRALKVKEEQIAPKIGHFELADKIANHYCIELKQHNAGIVKWGMINAEIAYVQVNAMWLMAYYDIPQDLPLEEFVPLYFQEMEKRVYQRQDEIDGANKLMKTVASDIASSKAVIIDLRFNQGGKDEVGLEFFSHFVNEKTQIATKKARLGDGYTNHQSLFLEPQSPYYDGHVYVLTSHMTASAAEVATIASLALDNASIIGSHTEGIFSDGLDKKLPNGWEFVLSNEIYLDNNGHNYEGKGVTPHVDLNYPKDRAHMLNTIYNQLQSSGDQSIDKALGVVKRGEP